MRCSPAALLALALAVADLPACGAGDTPAADAPPPPDAAPDAAPIFDSDCDGVLDPDELDADDDGILDDLEGDADPDGDGRPRWRDVDSDGDGLPDGAEDLNADGAVQDGETDAALADSDGDGDGDLVEWARDGDPAGIVLVLPHEAAEQTRDVEVATDIIKVDVFFEVDATSSMGGLIDTIASQFAPVIVPQLALVVPNLAFGVASFRDFPVDPFGVAGDLPFVLAQRTTSVTGNVQAALDALEAAGGGDGEESDWEALYQTATGAGITWPGSGAGVPIFDPAPGFDPASGHGVIGGGGFRFGALPVVIHVTDGPAHDAADYVAAGIVDAHSRADAVAAAQLIGLRFIPLTTSTSGLADLELTAIETGAYTPATGPVCPSGRPPAGPLCPIAVATAAGSLGNAIANAVALLVDQPIDVSAVAVADPDALPGVDTAAFITAITPVAPPPAGATIVGDRFADVVPGAPVTFRVHARNTQLPDARDPRLYRAVIRILGDDVAILDERAVALVLPGGAECVAP